MKWWISSMGLFFEGEVALESEVVRKGFNVSLPLLQFFLRGVVQVLEEIHVNIEERVAIQDPFSGV